MVLFRNGHFNTMVRHGGLLYLLVTAEGYLDLPLVVFEELTIQGMLRLAVGGGAFDLALSPPPPLCFPFASFVQCLFHKLPQQELGICATAISATGRHHGGTIKPRGPGMADPSGRPPTR